MQPIPINEGSTAYLSVKFKDKNGALAVPASISYRIDCLTSSQVIKAPTVVAPASSIEIVITPEENAIKNDANATEQRLVTVTATYGASDQVQDDFAYPLRNLRKAP